MVQFSDYSAHLLPYLFNRNPQLIDLFFSITINTNTKHQATQHLSSF